MRDDVTSYLLAFSLSACLLIKYRANTGVNCAFLSAVVGFCLSERSSVNIFAHLNLSYQCLPHFYQVQRQFVSLRRVAVSQRTEFSLSVRPAQGEVEIMYAHIKLLSVCSRRAWRHCLSSSVTFCLSHSSFPSLSLSLCLRRH